ncbi:MAG: energy-coupling factor transporter transmembrane protein EcfT [Moorella humiferrea]|nr:energy-coupling factor transporter transmembrane protein EcfT [Moorella humiferrea]
MVNWLGHYIPGRSPIHKLDPRVKIVGLVLYSVALLTAPTATATVVLGASIVPAIFLSGLAPSFIWRQLRPILLFLMAIFAFQAAVTPGEVIARVGPIGVTREGINYGFLGGARVSYLLLAAALLTATTDPLTLADGLEKLLRPGEKLGLPAAELALMLTMALRFVPTLLDEAERIMRAQLARGASFQGGKIKSLMPLIIPLFVSAFQRAEALAEAMEARGYQSGKGRTRMRELHFTRGDGLFLLTNVLLAFGSLYYRLKFGR